MAVTSRTYLANVLNKTELFSADQVDVLLDAARQGDASVTDVVARQGFAPEREFLQALAEAMKIPFVELSGEEIDHDVLQLVPTKAVFQYNVIPVHQTDGTLTVACNNPFDAGLRDMLRMAAGMRVRFALSTAGDIAKAVKLYYGVGADTVASLMDDNRLEVEPEEDLTKVELSELDQEASIVKFVNQIVWEAVQQEATDIHVEPMETSLRIRYRIDGVLHQTPVPPQLNRFQAAIISRIKVMANMDIAEKRLPMDGRIGLRVKGEELDIRVSTMPTVYGESVSLRLLQRSGEFIGLRELGLADRDSRVVRKVIHRPNGIILVTGPTGSGKSTSLYAFLHEINTIDHRIMTAEDPIEYEMAGINQVLVRPEISLTFAKALRHFLRQDPDVIMVGEVRDHETAEIAIQASLTGHLVFSTLHTNDSAGAFTRLLDMGVEPYLVASAVETVIAQRLVRRLCPNCKTTVDKERGFLEEIGFPLEAATEGRIFESQGCETCRKTGYRGRTGIFEVLEVTEAIRSLVIARHSMGEIHQQACRQGMAPLREDGWRKVTEGMTTLDEVLRVTEERE